MVLFQPRGKPSYFLTLKTDPKGIPRPQVVKMGRNSGIVYERVKPTVLN